MAEKNTATPSRQRKSYFEVVERRRETARERSKLSVCLGESFQRWRKLKEQKSLKTDALVATFLLDSYEKLTDSFSAKKQEPAISKPTSGPEQDHYEKLNNSFSAKKPEPAIPNPTSGPEQDHNEKLQLTTPGPPSAPLLDKCPSCGFALLQWCLQNGNTPNKEHQFESIEVTLELEQKDDPVSGAEEGDEESDVSEEESEGSGVNEGNEEGENSDKDWKPGPHYTRTLTTTNTSPTDTAAPEESGKNERRPEKKQLCTDCGLFYDKMPHECEHKTKPFVCNMCGKRCVSEAALKIHNRIHSESYEHLCKYCYANFKTKVDKLAHELIHQEQQDPYKCPDCAMTFETFNGRADHMKQHKSQFECAVCGIVFREKQRFLRHVVVHTGEKAFKCSVCEQDFNQEGHLKSHMRLHTGEKPYSCKHCDKSFNHNVSLKSHVQRYHPTEQEDILRETHKTDTEREKEGNEENKHAAAKWKQRWIPTGRPKGRPKRNSAKKRKYSKTTDYSDDESE